MWIDVLLIAKICGTGDLHCKGAAARRLWRGGCGEYQFLLKRAGMCCYCCLSKHTNLCDCVAQPTLQLLTHAIWRCLNRSMRTIFYATVQIKVTAPEEGGADQLVLSHGTRPSGQGLSDSSLLGTASMSESIDQPA